MAHSYTIYFKSPDSEHNEFHCSADNEKKAVEKFHSAYPSDENVITKMEQKGYASVYQIVTERMLEEMKKGIIPWQKPWHGLMDGAISYDTQRPYSFLNQLLLGRPGEWLTRNSIIKHGGSIKKGAKSGFITFWKTYLSDKDGNEVDDEKNAVEKRFVLRYYRAFHIDDTTGIESKLAKRNLPKREFHPIEDADRTVQQYVSRNRPLRLDVSASNSASYSPSLDVVSVPLPEQFDMREQFYSTLFHELGHSTGHSRRLDRKTGMKGHFGDSDYAKEELVAELTSAMLCNHLGFECDKTFKNSVAYLQDWMTALENDERLIVYASSQAEKAAKFILDIKEGEEAQQNHGN